MEDFADEAVKAVELHQEAYANANLTYGPDEATFKNACSGSSGANIEFRYIVLSRIIAEVGSNLSDDVNFSDEFKLRVEELVA